MIETDVFAVGDSGGGVQYILLELPIHGNVTTQAPGHQPIVFTQGNHKPFFLPVSDGEYSKPVQYCTIL